MCNDSAWDVGIGCIGGGRECHAWYIALVRSRHCVLLGGSPFAGSF